MDIALKKVELIEWLARVEDKSIIKKVESLKTESLNEKYEANLKPMSSKAYKEMLERSLQDLKLVKQLVRNP
jgi:hypothetical protein